MSDHFGDRLAAIVENKNSRLVVGLDPHWDLIPASFRRQRSDDPERVIVDYFSEVVRVTAESATAFKPQMAFFEQFGVAGVRALGLLIGLIQERDGIVLLDGKRNDIGSTANAYARAYFGEPDRPAPFPADAVTLNPLLGSDSIKPFISDPANGVFVLVKTSNPSSREFQDLALASGGSLCDRLASKVAEWNRPSLGSSGFGNVGAVVGATFPEHMKRLRQIMPQSWILVPGYGAQGGCDDAIKAAFMPGGLGALINSSRGISFPDGGSEANFEAVREAARKAQTHINEMAKNT